MKELADKSEEQFNCLGENIEKYITFSVLIEKEVICNIAKTTSYRLPFIDSARFMVSLSLNLANNLADGIHKIKCK